MAAIAVRSHEELLEQVLLAGENPAELGRFVLEVRDDEGWQRAGALAFELGPKGIRVHAISPGPLATRAASGIPEFDELLAKAQSKAPARSLVSIDDVGIATAFLALDGAKLITGETLYIDGGYHIID